MSNFELEAKIQAWILLGPVLLAMIAMFFIVFNPLGILILAITFLGGYFVVRSKVKSKLRTREPIEWGSRKMNKKEKREYWMGYTLLAISVVFVFYQHLS